MQCSAAASRVLGGSTASTFTGSASLRQAAPRQQQQQQRASRQMGGATTAVSAPPAPKLQRPDSTGRYGRFGGKYVPETLIVALEELEAAYREARADPAFNVSGCWWGSPHDPHALAWQRPTHLSRPLLIRRRSWTRSSRTMWAAPRPCTTPSACLSTTAGGRGAGGRGGSRAAYVWGHGHTSSAAGPWQPQKIWTLRTLQQAAATG